MSTSELIVLHPTCTVPEKLHIQIGSLLLKKAFNPSAFSDYEINGSFSFSRFPMPASMAEVWQMYFNYTNVTQMYVRVM